MQEVAIKSHLIITDVHDEYEVNWCGRFKDSNPLFVNDLPVFAIVGSGGRVELNTIDVKYIERAAKSLTQPRGRQAITTDKTCIYIKEEDGNEKLMGVVTHKHVKKYAPMYDKVGCR